MQPSGVIFPLCLCKPRKVRKLKKINNMNKTLTVIKPYGWMEPGEIFELSADGKTYVNTHTNEYSSTLKDADINSKMVTEYSISTDFAKDLISDGILDDGEKKEGRNFVNVFDTMDDMLDTYQKDLNNIDTDMKDSPACLKIEKETVLRNLIKTLSYLRSLKK